MTHTAKQYATQLDFEDDLILSDWAYSMSQGNPNAVSFNGGYVDMGNFDASATLPGLSFYYDYTVNAMSLDPYTYTTTYEYPMDYWVQSYNGTYVACYEGGSQATYNGTTYTAVVMVFMDTDDNLVVTLTLYDAQSGTFIEISNYNVFESYIDYNGDGGDYDDYDDYYPDHSAMYWDSQEAFETELMSWVWTYYYTDEQMLDIDTGDISMSDITPDTLDRMIFYDDETVNRISEDDGTIVSDEYSDYGFDTMLAYVYIGEYDCYGTTYELDCVYYIDCYGYLVERLALYDYDDGSYYYISNANIYYAEGM